MQHPSLRFPIDQYPLNFLHFRMGCLDFAWVRQLEKDQELLLYPTEGFGRYQLECIYFGLQWSCLLLLYFGMPFFMVSPPKMNIVGAKKSNHLSIFLFLYCY